MRWKVAGPHRATNGRRSEGEFSQEEKDLKRLNRRELLEILVEQGRRIDELTEEVSRLKRPAPRELTGEEIEVLVDAARRINRAYPPAPATPAVPAHAASATTSAVPSSPAHQKAPVATPSITRDPAPAYPRHRREGL